MKLSIYNFKTIRKLIGLNFNSINIISGVNSAGKTSFIQFLLMLKQTLEVQSANPALIFDGNWVKLGNFENLVYKKDVNNSIGFELEFDKEHIKDKFNHAYGIENVVVKVNYKTQNSGLILNEIELKYESPQMPRKSHFMSFIRENKLYKLNTDTSLFGNDFMSIIGNSGILNTTSFIPITFSTEVDNPDYRNIEGIGLLDDKPKKMTSIALQATEIQDILNCIFSNISYLGPLRKEPQDFYDANIRNKFIGNKGEYAAQFLEEEAGSVVEFYDIETKKLQQKTLSEAVKYWICDVFNLAKDIKAEKYKDSFIVKVINHYDVESTIRQVGFGISQVLPIIIEGLRMNKNGILILEQPEIHLHPKIQSMLFDFIYSMSLTGKKFVIETHSDHFITRMRRRVAEDNNNLANKINLVFVEQREAEHLFRKLDLDDMGTFDYFPNDFVEQSEDYDAIIMAQAKKAMTKDS
jgi:predicted ATPase